MSEFNTVACTVVDADTVRYGGSAFRRVSTCELDDNGACSECGASIERVTHSVFEMGDSYACHPNFCPNCGAKVVGE